MSLSVKQISTIYLISLILIFSFFLTRQCSTNSNSSDIVTIKTPEVKGSFKDIKFEEIKIPSAPKVIVYNNKEIIIDSKINDSLFSKYIVAKDSLEMLKLYLNAIQIRNYNKVVSDSNMVANINVTTTGTLDKLDFEYLIRSKTIHVPIKSKNTVFAIYAGGGLKNTLLLDEFAMTANLGFQNKKGDIISLQYSTDKSIQLNYSFKILDIKK